MEKSGALTEDVIRQMLHTGPISSAEKVLDVKIERIPHSYPIYELNYLKAIDFVMKELSRFKKLVVMRRTGSFLYNNMDHSIKSGLETAAAILHSREAVDELRFREEFSPDQPPVSPFPVNGSERQGAG